MHDIDMFQEIGFQKDNQGEYKARPACHMDCYKYVMFEDISFLTDNQGEFKSKPASNLSFIVF